MVITPAAKHLWKKSQVKIKISQCLWQPCYLSQCPCVTHVYANWSQLDLSWFSCWCHISADSSNLASTLPVSWCLDLWWWITLTPRFSNVRDSEKLSAQAKRSAGINQKNIATFQGTTAIHPKRDMGRVLLTSDAIFWRYSDIIYSGICILKRCYMWEASPNMSQGTAHAERQTKHRVPRSPPLGTACSWGSNSQGPLLQCISSGDNVGKQLGRPFSAAGSTRGLLSSPLDWETAVGPRTPPRSVLLLTQHHTSPTRAPGWVCCCTCTYSNRLNSWLYQRTPPC